ncbi:MAG: lysophospholipid acyltransferase family protein [Armatimonadota bacterium]
MDDAAPAKEPKHDTYWLLETAGNCFLWLMGGLAIAGDHRVPKTGAVLYVSNHASFLDPVAIGVASPRRVVFMAKAELFKHRILAWLLDGVDTFPVRRGEPDRAAFKTTLDMLADGRAVCIFPEGTRSPDGNLMAAEQGAAVFALKTGCPVVPVYVDGSHRVWGAGKGLRRGRIAVHYGDPFTLDKGMDREAAGARLMEAIAAVRDARERDPLRAVPPHRFRKPVEGHRFKPVAKSTVRPKS